MARRLCTVRLARRLLPELPSRSLDSLTHHFGFENPARHRAGGDALVTAQLLERLIAMARERGLRTLAELEGFSRTRVGRRGRGRGRRAGPGERNTTAPRNRERITHSLPGF